MMILLGSLALAVAGPANPPSDPVVVPHAGGLTAEEEHQLDDAAVMLGDDEIAPLSEEELRTYPDARDMPVAVQRFIVRYQSCRHWLGEPDFDEARRREIARAVAEACPGVDAVGRSIRRRYAGNPQIIDRLRDYGPLGQ